MNKSLYGVVILAAAFATDLEAAKIVGRVHGEDLICCGTFEIGFDPTPVTRDDGWIYYEVTSLAMDWQRTAGHIPIVGEIEPVHIVGSSPTTGVVRWPTDPWFTAVTPIGDFEVAFQADEISYRRIGTTQWHDEAVAVDYEVIAPEPSACVLALLGLLCIAGIRRSNHDTVYSR